MSDVITSDLLKLNKLCYGWTFESKELPRKGELIVKLIQHGAVWALEGIIRFCDAELNVRGLKANVLRIAYGWQVGIFSKKLEA